MLLNANLLANVLIKNAKLAKNLGNLTKCSKFSTLHSVSTPTLYLPNLNRIERAKGIYFVSANKIHNSLILEQSEQSKDKNSTATLKNKSVLGSQSASSTGQSVLTDDLVKKYANVAEKEASGAEPAESAKQSENTGKNEAANAKGAFSKLFSREHGWKLSLAFIVLMGGSVVAYFLTTFGPPKLDENNQPVHLASSIDLFNFE